MRTMLAILCLLFCAGFFTESNRAAGGVFSGLGIALTPANFPHHNDADVRQMFALGKEAGKYAVFIYQWSQPDLHDVARKVLKMSEDSGLTP
ncbi:MAG TPA: hypothetical protein VER98_02680, partial [Terriglobia bacterium]|nr:hypothetical protein [Terriglobia bacterium]